MSLRNRFAGLLVCAAGFLAPPTAFAHAALIEAETVQAIRLHAYYDTGAPMPHAQVIIYAPDNPAMPWGRGETDHEGRFEFIPDAAQGLWSVQVRQAGHGVMAHVDMSGDLPAVVTVSGTTGWLQRAVMVALVAWGAWSTVLFALHRKERKDASA